MSVTVLARPRPPAAHRLGPALLDRFGSLSVIHLGDRRDRRHGLGMELARVGLTLEDPRIRLVEGCRKADAHGFDSPGAHGCFLSHLGLLKEAQAKGLPHVLIAEDDLGFLDPDRAPGPLLPPEGGDWDLFFGGYHWPERFTDRGPGLHDIGPAFEVTGCHLYAVSARAYAPVIARLEAAYAGPAPRPHVDVALSEARTHVPGCVTLVATPAIGIQRRSRSDIQALKLYDRIAPLRPVTDTLRKLAGRRAC